MKHLIIMRHAKANQGEFGQPDFERTLNERGIKDAGEMGHRIKQKQFIPELIIASPAKRTQKTAKEIAKKLDYNTDSIVYDQDIYNAHSEEILYVIRQTDDTINATLLVGHNPGVTGLVGILTDSLIENMPTAGVAFISFDITSWRQLAPRMGKLEWFDFPKSSQ